MGKDDLTRPKQVLTPVAARMISAAAEIMAETPDKADFLHTVLCRMPRKRTEGRTFTRTNGGIALEHA